MKNKGFTLAELLAVITLLGLLMALAYPKLLNIFEKKEKEMDEYTLNLIYASAENYVKKDINKYPHKTGNVACLYLKNLVDENLIKTDIPNEYQNKLVKIVMKDNNDYNTSLVDKCLDSNDITYKTGFLKTTEIIDSVEYNNDRIYYFENDILVREINNISLINKDEKSTTNFDLIAPNYKELFNLLNTKEGIYTTYDLGDGISTMFIDIDYKNENYVDDLENEDIYNNASLFIKYNKDTNYNDVELD